MTAHTFTVLDADTERLLVLGQIHCKPYLYEWVGELQLLVQRRFPARTATLLLRRYRAPRPDATETVAEQLDYEQFRLYPE